MNVKAVASWVMLWLAGFTMMALLLGVGLGVAGAADLIQEDDKAWNCHLMGDMNCGPNVAWHGFVNF